jgi:1,2-diacylglycerol 3-alpha-glucosyltransferase
MLALLDHNKFIATFAGYGSEYSSLQNYAYTIKKLSPHLVKFIEKPSKQQLKELYHTAHLFIFASQTETQGLVLAEAMAHGIPVIALNGPGQQDIIKNGLNGFLVTTLDEMKAKIEYCCASEKQYKLMQHHASHTAQEYSSNILIEKLLRFYYNVLAKV